MSNNQWFTVHKEGLAAQQVGQAKGRPLWELFQNAVDEDTTTIEIELHPTATRGVARLTVTDDSPDGFADLTDAWTFFKPSRKAGDPEKRGRFNTGEKTALALCRSATITSTRGKVSFNEDGTRTFSARTKRDSGTVFDGMIRMTKPEIDEALDDMRRVLIPTSVNVTLNGEKLEPRTPVRTFTTTLDTQVNFKVLRRKTGVLLYEPADGETPTIFEMDIPVVSHDGRWHINVMQKVPLNADRDNVTPAYLRSLRTAVLNEMAEELTEEDASSSWVTDVIPYATDDAALTALTKWHGEDAVVYDPSDPESNKQAMEHGHSVVHGRSMGKALWETNRRVGALKPAGQVFPSGVPTSPDGKPPIPHDDWTEAMRNLARYTEEVGDHLLGFSPMVEFQSLNNRHGAWWGSRVITFNLGSLGRNWPERVTVESLDALLIHEFAHHVASDHLTAAFYDECCRLGAKLRSCTAQLRETSK